MRLANQWWRYNSATMPFGQAHVCPRYSGRDLPRGEDAKDGREIGRAAALPGPPRLFVRWNRPAGERFGHSKKPERVPFWGSRLRYVPGGICHPGVTQTNGVEIIERRRCPSGISFVLSPLESTSRTDARNVGDEIARGATSIAAPLRFFPADVAEQVEQNRRPHIKSEESPLFRSCHRYFSGGVEHTRGKNPSRTKRLREAPLRHCCPGYFSGGSDHAGGENTDNSR